MIRKIITINEELCDGCGNCVVGCSEGALQIIDGKAKLVKEDFCDGFGDCIGTCPTGALKIEEREAADFNLQAVKQHLLETQGVEAVWRMEEAQQRHISQPAADMVHFGCPGARQRVIDHAHEEEKQAQHAEIESQLSQWPVQLHLVHPSAPYFRNRELLIMSTCGPVAAANLHSQYLKNRSIVVGCPKLDDTRPYAQKLAMILSEPSIPKAIVVRMEVPCCGGLTAIASQAVEMSGRKDIILEEHILSVEGNLKMSRTVSV